MPETLYTNSPAEVRSFIRAKAGKVIYKPFLPTVWSDGTHSFTPYTTILSEETLVDDSLRQTPGIFQELVPKAYEVRLTMMGNRGFAAKVHSQETVSGRLDWRQAPEELRLETFRMPPHLEERCAALLRELGLVFGCIDFIVTPEGEFVFLEVNEMGQFLFVERYCGLPLLDAFTNFLIQASFNWEWDERAVAVRYTDRAFDTLVLEKLRTNSQTHVGGPARLAEE
jgi:glutathione synthase/RimK-type ligase-like ATP-grasp enzyme